MEKYKKGNAELGDYFILVEGELSDEHNLASFDKTLGEDVSSCHHPIEFEKSLYKS